MAMMWSIKHEEKASPAISRASGPEICSVSARSYIPVQSWKTLNLHRKPPSQSGLRLLLQDGALGAWKKGPLYVVWSQNRKWNTLITLSCAKHRDADWKTATRERDSEGIVVKDTRQNYYYMFHGGCCEWGVTCEDVVKTQTIYFWFDIYMYIYICIYI